MIDREKVIKGLKCCGSKGMSACASEKCPYYPDKYEWDECTSQLANDALELLKTSVAIDNPWIPCRDCKHWDSNSGLTARKCEMLGIITKQCDWCSKGEKRDEVN